MFTTLAFVTLDEHGDRDFSFARKPGADTCLRFEELPLETIQNTRVFHFGTLSLTDEPARTATKQAVAYAKACGKTVSFDPNLRRRLCGRPCRLPLHPDQGRYSKRPRPGSRRRPVNQLKVRRDENGPADHNAFYAHVC